MNVALPVADAAPALDVEPAIRARLGIPADAEQVLIFAETSHWDPNWLYTTEEYYERCIPTILTRAVEALDEEPRRVYSVESLFFLQLFWQRVPAMQPRLRELINAGRLRLTGTGITTPDTVLPDTEAILRDYSYGQQWLRDNGMTVEPRVAYLPDDFGHSPALPAMLAALGLDMVAITRIDGMYFIGSDYQLSSSFPLAGSSAALLTKEHATADFIWRASDGSEVLCHWNPFTYFQGDMLASLGVVRWMDRVYGIDYRSARHIARRVRRYVRDLRPLARTPYLFCPIGGDFNGPIPGLVALLERHNRTRYETTGTYLVNACLQDYLELVGCHRSRLPTIALDPNPYWMGFYASRPEAKRRSNRIVRKLILAEKLAVLPHIGLAPVRDGGDAAAEPKRAPSGSSPPDSTSRPVAVDRAATPATFQRDTRAAWDLVCISNHHDFITGTSPDRIWAAEQQRWLEQAEALADGVLERISAVRRRPSVRPFAPPPNWRLEAGVLVVAADHYRAELREAAGGCLTSFRPTATGHELLAGPANDLVSYRDQGGLWRMGQEFRGGGFSEVVRASSAAARIEAREIDDLLEVRVESTLEGRPFVRLLWFRTGSPIVRMRLTGSAKRRRTVTCRFPSVLRAENLAMDVPGGLVVRPLRKLYDPTFWPARSFAHFRNAPEGPGLAVFLGGPAAIAATGSGALEWVALRYAPRETAFGLLPIPAHPATGSDPHEGQLDYAVWFTERGDARENRLPHHVRRALRSAMFEPNGPDLDRLANGVVVVDRDDVQVTALKPAHDGRGIIARLSSFAGQPVDVRLWCPTRNIRSARLCDARERDLANVPLRDGCATIAVHRSITSVRIGF